MPAKKIGTPIGALDELLLEICVGDTVVDAQGRKYTVDKNSWLKPCEGGSSKSLQVVGPVTVLASWDGHGHAVSAKRPADDRNEEAENLKAIKKGVQDAGDQTLVDELRRRGWKVTCSKVVEKVVYEEVAL